MKLHRLTSLCLSSSGPYVSPTGRSPRSEPPPQYIYAGRSVGRSTDVGAGRLVTKIDYSALELRLAMTHFKRHYSA
jgi:hypothetical protein